MGGRGGWKVSTQSTIHLRFLQPVNLPRFCSVDATRSATRESGMLRFSSFLVGHGLTAEVIVQLERLLKVAYIGFAGQS